MPSAYDPEKLANRRRKKGGTLMAKALAYVALVVLILTLGSTLITIWAELNPKADLLTLTQHLLSWPVIAGGLAVGGAKTFNQEIKDLLKRIARQH
jgi:hypothetical protein